MWAFYARHLPSYSWLGYRARRLFWRDRALDFTGQHWVVTGASAGLGRAITLQALRAGARVTAVARNPATLQALCADASALGLSGLHTLRCDCSLQSQVEALVQILAHGAAPVDVLVNNAGQLLHDCTRTAEGREASFATNVLGPYLLTEGLWRAGGFSGRRPMVLCMASEGGTRIALDTRPLNIADPARYRGMQAYGQHKRAQIALAAHWRALWGPHGVDVYAMHPGWVDTGMVRSAMPAFRATWRLLLRDATAGSDTAVWLAATRPAQPDGEWIWFDRRARPLAQPQGTPPDPDARSRLVAWLQTETAPPL